MPALENQPERQLHPDVTQLRALGHPLRLRIIALLRTDGPATASGLAARLGLNSGATSYHLRRLADAGLIEDDTERGNARDRWWKASHETTQTTTKGVEDPEALVALRGYHDIVVAAMLRQVGESVAERGDLPLRWQQSLDASDWQLTLTPDQADEVQRRLHQVLDDANREFGGTDRISETDGTGAGDGTAPVVFHLHSFPAPGRVSAPHDEQLEPDEQDQP